MICYDKGTALNATAPNKMPMRSLRMLTERQMHQRKYAEGDSSLR